MRRLFGWMTAALACMLLFMPQAVSRGVANGLSICANAILPSLFPFFVLTEFWVQAGYAHRIGLMAAPLTKRLFHLPGTAATAVILGMIGGYPMGAKTVASLYEKGQLTNDDAAQALFFCSNAGPSFLFGVIGVGVFQSVGMGFCLYLIHLFSAFLIGIIFRPKTCSEKPIVRETETPLPKAIVSSIRQGGMTAISVCVFVVFFSVLGSLFPFLTVSSGLLELSRGADMLAASNFPVEFKAIMASGFVGFGGLCVMVQTISILQEVQLSCRTYCIGKLLHAILSMAITWLFLPYLPLSAPCFTQALPTCNIVLFRTMLLSTLLLLFVKISSGKTGRNRI